MACAKGNYRIVVLVVATACLSMMLANILTLNFTIICMTEEKFRWENFSVDLGFDIFERVDFESRTPSKVPDSDIDTSTPQIITHGPSISLPDFEIPGIHVPTPGFNWQSFKFVRQNPQLFLRLIKTIAWEVTKLAAERAGEALDPRKIDFSKFREGFNLTDINEGTLLRVKEYILRRISLAQTEVQAFDEQGRNISEWRKVRIQDLELHNITWNGVINGRIRFLERAADHYYIASEKALLFGIVAVGALIAIPIVSLAIEKLGCRRTFTIVGCISAVSTALCPLAASLGLVPFLVVRCIQGVGLAACFPVIGAVTSAWARLTENGLFNGALTSFIQLAPVVAMPMSGILCSTIGWQFVFYLHALLTAILTVVWWLIYRDAASEHTKVTIAELRLIQDGKVIDGQQRNTKFPFVDICTDISVWAIWIAAVGNFCAIQMMILFSPSYMREILHYEILNIGFAAALPTLLQFVVKMFAGILSDKICKLGETCKVKVFNSIAFCGMALFMLALAATPVQYFRLALLFMVLTVSILGFNTGGFFKSATLVGRQYAYFVNTKVQIIMCAGMLCVPMLVYAMTPNNSPGEWSRVFIFHALLLLACNVIFCLFGSGLAAPFTQRNGTSPAERYGVSAVNDQHKPIIKGTSNGHTTDSV